MNKYIFLLLFVLCSSVLCAQKQELDEFNFKMFNEMCADKPNENIIYSPVSMNLTLGMILNGADEESQNKIKDVMGLSKYSMEQLNDCLNKSLDRVTYTWGNNYFSIEARNSVWLQNGYDYNRNYVDTLKKYYDAKFFNVDFTSSESVEAINKWTDEQSQSLLPKIYESSLQNSTLDIESNLYFRDRLCGDYMDQMKNYELYNIDGEKVNVGINKFLLVDYGISYSINDYFITYFDFDPTQGHGGIEGVYPQSRFEKYSLVICIPYNVNAPKDLLPVFAQDEDSLLTDYRTSIGHAGKRILCMPNLLLDQRISLDSYFTKLTDIDLQSDIKLSNVSNNSNIVLSLLSQNVHLDLKDGESNSSEQTSVHRRKRDIKTGTLDLCIDRPFKFIIVNQDSRDILFMGSINKLEVEDVTNVNSVTSEGKRDGNVYDIHGRKCSSASKTGLYIKNGKKKIVKNIR